MCLNDSERLELARIEIDNLRKMLDDANQQVGELRRQRDDARDARDGALRSAAADADIILQLRRRWPLVLEALEMPRPMCSLDRQFEKWANPLASSKPDPLEDIMPPV
jgi:hypothetical protein